MTTSRLSSEDRKEMNDTTYAFPRQRKEPLMDASHVRNAIARFDQVKDVSDEDREAAFRNIQAAARRFGVEMTETNWHQLGNKPHSQRA
jgi:cell division protein FtsX